MCRFGTDAASVSVAGVAQHDGTIALVDERREHAVTVQITATCLVISGSDDWRQPHGRKEQTQPFLKSLPASSPVQAPSLSAQTPLTITARTPSGYWCGEA